MRTLLVVGLLSMLAVIAAFAGIYAIVERPDDVRDRLEAYAGLAQRKSKREAVGREGLSLVARVVGRLLGGRALGQGVALRLAQANARLTVPEFVLISAGAGVIGALVGLALQQQLISALGGALLAFVAPWLWLERKRQRRLRAFHDQLIDVVVLIVGSLRSGHGLLNALDLASKEMIAPASEEFARVMREIGLGISQTEALNNLVRRMESRDLELMVTAINISHEVGGNLSLVLDKIAETLRERIRLHGEIRVLTTQQRLTSYLLVSLPFFLGAAIAVLNPTYMLQLFKPGWIMIPVAAATAAVLGFFVAQSLTRIEV